MCEACGPKVFGLGLLRRITKNHHKVCLFIHSFCQPVTKKIFIEHLSERHCIRSRNTAIYKKWKEVWVKDTNFGVISITEVF